MFPMPGITRVIYPGRSDHPDHQIAQRILPNGAGNMLSFELAGGRESAANFLKSSGIPFCPSLGHSGTTISYPAATSHRGMSPEERQRLGVTEGLLRLSVGIEPIGQTLARIQHGLP